MTITHRPVRQGRMLRSAISLLAAAAALTGGTAGSAGAAPTIRAAQVAPVSLLRTIDVGSNPYGVAIAQNLGKAFVVNDGSVSAVSLITHRPLGEFTTGGGQGQNAIALTGNDTRGWITDNLRTTVTVIDTERSRVVNNITVGYGGIAVVKANTSAGQRVYVAISKIADPTNRAANSLIGIQAGTGKIVSRTALPDVAGAVTTSPDAKSIWVGSTIDGRIRQISTATGKVTKTLKATQAGPVTGIAFAPGGKVWVTGLAGVAVINSGTGAPITFLTAPAVFPDTFVEPNAVQVNGSGTYAFVENSVQNGQGDTSGIAAIDTRTYKVAFRVRTGSQPEAFALDTRRGMAYVPNYDDDTLTFFSIPR